MHQIKCKASDCKKVLGEGRREHKSKVGDIDKSRSGLNKSYRNKAFKNDYSAKHIKDYIRNTLGVKRKIQNDAVLMCSAIVDLPKDYEGDPNEFFRVAMNKLIDYWCEGKEERVIQAEVHYDEKTPHMHFAYIPIAENKKGEPALSARKLVNINKLKQWHPWMQKQMSAALKHPVKITLTDEEREERENDYIDDLSEFKERRERMEKLEAEAKVKADKIISDAEDKASKILIEASKEREATKALYGAVKADLQGLKKAIDDSIPRVRYKAEELNEEFKIFREKKIAKESEKAGLQRKQQKLEMNHKKLEEQARAKERQKQERVQESLRRVDQRQNKELSSDTTLSL